VTEAPEKPPLLQRWWVICLLLLVVLLIAGGAVTARDWRYWGRPSTEVTVTDVVYRGGPEGEEQGRCRGATAKLEVVDADGRSGVLYDCGTGQVEGDAFTVVWHPEKDVARNDVVSPGLAAAVLGVSFVVFLGLAALVRRR
jgi:hypothetical protein